MLISTERLWNAVLCPATAVRKCVNFSKNIIKHYVREDKMGRNYVGCIEVGGKIIIIRYSGNKV
jgi:hypothetical protein